MRDLTTSEHAAVLLILATKVIAPPLAPIIEACGEQPLADLEALGLIVRWQSDDGERVVLTEDGAWKIADDIGALYLTDRLEWVQVIHKHNGQVEYRREQSEEPHWHTGPSGRLTKHLSHRPNPGDRRGVPCPAEPGKWVQLQHPELIEAPPSEDEPDEFLVDEVSEQPIELFRGPDGMAPGVKVRIDKLRRKGAKKPRRRGPKRAG